MEKYQTMKIYTLVILDKAMKARSYGRIETMSFKAFDSAVEYAIDWLVKMGLAETDEIDAVIQDFKDEHHIFTIGTLEFYITENELNSW